MRTVAVLFGGRSLEHDVSVLSGLQVLHALDPSENQPIPVYVDKVNKWWTGEALWRRETFARGGPDRRKLTQVTLSPGFGKPSLISVEGRQGKSTNIDVFLPVFHGTFGEDGCVQGVLEMSGAAYVGSGVLASSVGMSKRMTKIVAQQMGVPVVPWTWTERTAMMTGGTMLDDLTDSIDELLGWPVIVKPSNLGSSAGVSIAGRSDLAAALLKVFECDTEALVEKFVGNRLEINVAVAGLDEPIASVTEMPVTATDSLLSFADKYKKRGRKIVGSSEGMASALRVLDPPSLPPSLKNQAQGIAVTVFRAIGCEGIARVDCLIDTTTDEIFFNEINTIPGSLAYYLWSAAPHYLTITELLGKLLKRAEHICAMRRGLQRDPPAELRLL